MHYRCPLPAAAQGRGGGDPRTGGGGWAATWVRVVCSSLGGPRGCGWWVCRADLTAPLLPSVGQVADPGVRLELSSPLDGQSTRGIGGLPRFAFGMTPYTPPGGGNTCLIERRTA